ncbi:MAG: replication-associated recombination protein A [Patescibacteria group bacterium]|nr:replication-associated recombination protein A [Patescibacteria group bacterium]
MTQSLTERLRPKTLNEFIGQEHLIGEKGVIRKMVKEGKIVSMILWGPPGSGKTTLARLIGQHLGADFVSLSGINQITADLKKIIKRQKETSLFSKKTIIVFIDEIHRLNKTQQTFFLPLIEEGEIVLIGATTENPGFEIIPPLLSRCQVYKLRSLEDQEIKKIISQGLQLFPDHQIDKRALQFLISFSCGDARKAINALELAVNLSRKIDLETIKKAIQIKTISYDKNGDLHYDTFSAFIKSMRGCNPDATLHYLARMIKAGEDPVIIARRMVIFASEDIGNAQPTALILATTCLEAVQMIGMPEAALILAQTATYLACAQKSIAVTTGLQEALKDLETINPGSIPLHLRNQKNLLDQQLGFDQGHIRYQWLIEKLTGKKVNQEYLPENLRDKICYIKDWDENYPKKDGQSSSSSGDNS